MSADRHPEDLEPEPEDLSPSDRLRAHAMALVRVARQLEEQAEWMEMVELAERGEITPRG